MLPFELREMASTYSPFENDDQMQISSPFSFLTRNGPSVTYEPFPLLSYAQGASPADHSSKGSPTASFKSFESSIAQIVPF